VSRRDRAARHLVGIAGIEILAGAKAAPRAGQQNRATPVFAMGDVECGGHGGMHLVIERVKPVRPVQRDFQHVAIEDFSIPVRSSNGSS
jgi:hypothetical protein